MGNAKESQGKVKLNAFQIRLECCDTRLKNKGPKTTFSRPTESTTTIIKHQNGSGTH
jgi:hypothetical protein